MIEQKKTAAAKSAGKAAEKKTEVKTTAAKKTMSIRAELFQKAVALIPNKVSNELVVDALELLRKQQKAMKKDFTVNLKRNETAFKNHGAAIQKHGGYIEDQNNFTDMAYGEATMQYSGCEIFATFNALFNLLGSYPMSLPKMIAEYEKDGMVFSGKFGTAPKAIADFLKRQGFHTEMVTKEAEFDALGKKSDTLILTMYNDKDDISQEVHTVNISKEKGKLIAHNVYCNGKTVGPYATVSEVIQNINGGKAKGISLIGVKKL